MEEHGYKDILKNFVQKIYDHSLLHMKLSSSLPIAAYARKSIDEPLDHIRSVRMHWEQGILEELKAIIQESKRPFMLLRDSDAVNPFLQQTSMISSEKEGGVKFLFDSEDLMETILAIKNSNLKAIQAERSLGLIKLNVATPDFDKLSRRYAEFHNSHSQLGLDDAHANAQGFKVLAQRHEEAEAIIASGSILDARKLMRRGVPPSLRCKIWRIACGLHESVTAVEEQHFLRLRKQCDTMDLITDELFMHDIQTVLDDPRFFVFEEELKEVVLSFSRDEWVREHTSYDIHAPLLNQMGLDFEKSAAPPCGLQPYLGFATYFAPLCYIFRDKTSLYHVSKFLFCTLWCRMNVISASVEYDNTLIYVCKTFENLLIQFHPQLVIHMINIGLPPLKVSNCISVSL